MAKKRLIFVLDDERDLEILSWWQQQENKSAAIRALIRRDIRRGGVALCDIYQAVIEIDRRLAAGRVLVTNGDATGATFDEPPDVATALDSLGL